MTVTHTGMPAARSRSTSTRRFSSRLATTRSGRSRAIAAWSGFFVPRTRAHVETGRMGAPVGRPHQQVGHRHGQGFGDRGHQGDQPSRTVLPGERAAEVVVGVWAPFLLALSVIHRSCPDTVRQSPPIR